MDAVHVMPVVSTMTNMRQAVARSFRFCSHKGRKWKQQGNKEGWLVPVYTYLPRIDQTFIYKSSTRKKHKKTKKTEAKNLTEAKNFYEIQLGLENIEDDDEVYMRTEFCNCLLEKYSFDRKLYIEKGLQSEERRKYMLKPVGVKKQVARIQQARTTTQVTEQPKSLNGPVLTPSNKNLTVKDILF